MEKYFRKLTLLATITIAAISAQAGENGLSGLLSAFNLNEKICVGYKSTKQVPIMGTTDVFGTKCDEINLENDLNKNIKIVLNPTFKSGNGLRDGHVQELLGGKDNTPIEVTFQVSEAFLNFESEITSTGTINIQNQITPITALISKISSDFYGIRIIISFSALKINRPKVGPFGIGGSVDDELTLFGKISKDKAESLISKSNEKGL